MSEPVTIGGRIATITLTVRAIVYGDWAAHATVRHDEDGTPSHTGWIVTHIPSGIDIPAWMIDGLDREEAIAIAWALSVENVPCIEDWLQWCHSPALPTSDEAILEAEGIVEAIIAAALGDGPRPALAELSPQDVLLRAAHHLEAHGGGVLDAIAAVIPPLEGALAVEATLRLARWIDCPPGEIAAWQQSREQADVLRTLRSAAS